jgi:hypothetical protein
MPSSVFQLKYVYWVWPCRPRLLYFPPYLALYWSVAGCHTSRCSYAGVHAPLSSGMAWWDPAIEVMLRSHQACFGPLVSSTTRKEAVPHGFHNCFPGPALPQAKHCKKIAKTHFDCNHSANRGCYD